MSIKVKAKQASVIVFDKNMNKKAWIEKAKSEGFLVRMNKKWTTLWRPVGGV